MARLVTQCGSAGSVMTPPIKGEERSANMVAPQYGVDTNWYLDSGATNHITGDLEKLTIRDRYT